LFNLGISVALQLRKPLRISQIIWELGLTWDVPPIMRLRQCHRMAHRSRWFKGRRTHLISCPNCLDSEPYNLSYKLLTRPPSYYIIQALTGASRRLPLLLEW
jgi:hypothetical protein